MPSSISAPLTLAFLPPATFWFSSSRVRYRSPKHVVNPRRRRMSVKMVSGRDPISDQPPPTTQEVGSSSAFPKVGGGRRDLSKLDAEDKDLLNSLNLGESTDEEDVDVQAGPSLLDTSGQAEWIRNDNKSDGVLNDSSFDVGDGKDSKLNEGEENGQSEPTISEDGELSEVGLMGTFLEGDDDVEDITGLVGNNEIIEVQSDSTSDDSFIELGDDNPFVEDKEEKSNIEEEVAARVGGGDIIADESYDNDSSKIKSLSTGTNFFDDEEDEGTSVDSPSAEVGDFDASSEPISSIRSRGYRPSSGRAALVDEPDENDDVDDVDDTLNPIDDDLGFESSIPLGDEDEDDEEIDAVDADDETLTDADADDTDTDDFDAESEEDIQSAAAILSDRGLLGLGVEKNRRRDASSVKKFALGEEEEDEEQFEEPSVVGEALGLPTMLEDDDVNEEDADVIAEGDKKDDIEDYPDMDDDDDDLGLTSQASFGKVWELNEDTYVTITEAGESFGYELDEEDQEDQDMATMRRGKQGGWSGGLASYPASDLPEGSREWIARRSYELMMKAAPADMHRWTRRHLGPPPEIAALYPDDPPAAAPLGKTTLQMSTPPAAVSMIGKYEGSSEDFDAGELDTYDDTEIIAQDDNGEQALNRSIKFPCQYKFKVEGEVDESFFRAIRETTEEMLGRRVPRSAFTSEPAGRYRRVTILVEVVSARQVTELYDALRSVSGVKFSYG